MNEDHVNDSHREIELRVSLVNMKTVKIAAFSKGKRRGIICRGSLAVLDAKLLLISSRVTSSLRYFSKAS